MTAPHVTATRRCAFCRELAGDPSDFEAVYGDRLGTRLLWGNDQFVVLVSLGALAPGHCLLVPKRHATAIAALPQHELTQAGELQDSIEDVLRESFGALVAFEHGSGNRNATGCGISHAHLHFVPVAKEPDQLPSAPFLKWKACPEDRVDHLASVVSATDGYLFYLDSCERAWASQTSTMPSQFMRSWVAPLCLPTLDWDWRSDDGANPAVHATIAWMRRTAPPRGLDRLHLRA
jgi:diadenosine tetraphosphate (Ap4A) HIT family hydrolase